MSRGSVEFCGWLLRGASPRSINRRNATFDHSLRSKVRETFLSYSGPARRTAPAP
jgi:hypothetical protein